MRTFFFLKFFFSLSRLAFSLTLSSISYLCFLVLYTEMSSFRHFGFSISPQFFLQFSSHSTSTHFILILSNNIVSNITCLPITPKSIQFPHTFLLTVKMYIYKTMFYVICSPDNLISMSNFKYLAIHHNLFIY